MTVKFPIIIVNMAILYILVKFIVLFYHHYDYYYLFRGISCRYIKKESKDLKSGRSGIMFRELVTHTKNNLFAFY